MKKETKCYDLRLGSDCNLDKDLSKKWGLSQLVKHKDTGLYLWLYIFIVLKENIQYIYVYNITRHEEKMRKQQGNSIYYIRC